MSSVTDSEDAVLELTGTIAPDWSRGVDHFTTRAVAITQSRSGREQRTSRSAYARKAIAFTVAGLDQAAAENLFETLENRAVGPLRIPWWPEGLRISTTMSGADSIQVETEPLADWNEAADRILVGDEVREIASISSRTITLVSESGTSAHDAGTWVFPMRLCAIDRPDDTLAIIRHDAARQRLRFIQLTK